MNDAFNYLHPALRYHVVNTLGWTGLRPTQIDAIYPIQDGENAILLAPTAGGKTEAVALPLLSRMAAQGWQGLSVLYVCPLRALLNNLEARLHRYAAFIGRRVGVWHGDVSPSVRRSILKEPPDLLLTTPESLEAIMISSRIDHAALLRDVHAVVVDELHAFASDDRGWHLLFLLERIERLAARHLQRVGLSATIGNPDELLSWLTRGRAGRIVGRSQHSKAGDVTTDYVASVPNAVKVLSRVFKGERRLVFADSRSRVEQVAAGLRSAGVRTFVSHASVSGDERRQAEAAFAAEDDCVIVATSTLELGLDVGDLDRVVQIGAPSRVGSFLQRMGRTGRRPDMRRNCLILATDEDELITALAVTDLWHEGFVERVLPPPRPTHLYAQQVMALILQERGIALSEVRKWLGSVANEVPEADRISVVQHMLEIGILSDDAGIIGIGPHGERAFGRRNFMGLVAAFAEPLLLTVDHAGMELGTIHPASLVGPSKVVSPVILLGGRSWKVTNVDWPHHRVSVVPVPGGGKSRWLGGVRMLSAKICRAAEKIIAGAEPRCLLSQRATNQLAELRERLTFVDGISLPIVADNQESVRIWSFGGGLASASIAEAARAKDLPTIAFDDFSLTVRASDIAQVAAVIGATDAGSAHPALPKDLSNELKFSLCLPTAISEAVLIARTSVPDDVADIVPRPRKTVRIPI